MSDERQKKQLQIASVKWEIINDFNLYPAFSVLHLKYGTWHITLGI